MSNRPGSVEKKLEGLEKIERHETGSALDSDLYAVVNLNPTTSNLVLCVMPAIMTNNPRKCALKHGIQSSMALSGPV